jgi:hypothetical protein
MQFTKYNNPNKKRKIRRRLDRSDADIIAAKAYYDDRVMGIEKPLVEYDRLSDQLCGKPSRGIYEEEN